MGEAMLAAETMSGWIWLGHAQHFIGARRCSFRMGTWLPNGYVVSTVGEFLINPDDKQFEEIGCDRLYETFVFKTSGNTHDCGCPVIDDFLELASHGYKLAKDAQLGHMAVCHEWSEI